jgi:serpin B
MKNLITIFFLLAFVTTSVSQRNETKESINSFSFKLFEQVYLKSDNCFFSPYSIFGALSMTYAGAKENTRLEMGKALEISNKDAVHSEFKALNSNIMLNREVQFLSSNSIWLQKNFKLDKTFSNQVEENYQAKSKNVDFANENDREKARKEINTWVDKQTKGNISNFIKPGILSENTAMLLVNAVYFKSIWQTEFLPKDTKDEKFLASSGDSVICKMMNNDLKTHYYEDEMAQVVEIPYENNKASLIVFLPKDLNKTDLKSFDYNYLTKASQSFGLKEVQLSLPAFKLEVDYELSDAMKKMGIKSAFEPGADFSGITGQKDLIISSILHKSIIEVSEKGTEASSTTAVISMRSTAIPSKGPVIFKADHPFLFIIRDNSTAVILFMGYMAHP